MKERIVIKDEIFADFLIKNKDNHNISASPKVIMDRCIVEKEPTNWEELKELCRNSKIPKCYFAQDLFIKTEEPLTYYEHICVDGVLFVENGCIYAGYENDNVSNNRTPANMWNIIKNLIGG